MLNVMFCTALLSILLPALTVQAAPGDLINVALANNLNVTFSRENPPSETAVKLFDNSSGTKWLAAQTTNVWVQLQFKFGDTQAVPSTPWCQPMMRRHGTLETGESRAPMTD